MKRISSNYKTLALVCCISLGFVAHVEARIWTDVSGQHRFEADLLRISDDFATASFVGPNGKEFELPWEALSSKDQLFVKEFLKKSPSSKTKKLTFADIPEQVLYKMIQAAKRAWPNDKSMQAKDVTDAAKKYFSKSLKTSTNPSTSDVPTAVINKLTELARQDWPASSEQQAQEVEEQLAYYRLLKQVDGRGVPPLAIAQLKHNARQIAPYDYRYQLRYVRGQIQAGSVHLAKLRAEAEQRELLTKLASREEAAKLEEAATETEDRPAEEHIAADDSNNGEDTHHSAKPTSVGATAGNHLAGCSNCQSSVAVSSANTHRSSPNTRWFAHAKWRRHRYSAPAVHWQHAYASESWKRSHPW